MPFAAQAQTGGASAPSGEASTSGGAGLVFSAPMRSAGATWYGPGLYGNGTACGQTLRPGTIGVAHRTLPCGTTVKINYHGHSLVTKVIDRGPYTPGNDFDLTNGARSHSTSKAWAMFATPSPSAPPVSATKQDFSV